MDEELKRRFAPKRLAKEIPGQRLFPTRQGRSFEYGPSSKSLLGSLSSCIILAGSRECSCRRPLRDSLGLSHSVRRFFGKSENRTWRATMGNLKRIDKSPLQVSSLKKGQA